MYIHNKAMENLRQCSRCIFNIDISYVGLNRTKKNHIKHAIIVEIKRNKQILKRKMVIQVNRQANPSLELMTKYLTM